MPGVHFGDDAAARILARRVNEEGARLRSDNPGRFGFFASLPLPDIDGALAEACYALDILKADGVVFKTNHHGVYLGDDRLSPLFAELNRRQAVIFIHPTSPACSCCADGALGYPQPMLEFMFDTTRAIFNMILSGALEKYRELKIIVPHAGAALSILADRVALLLPILSAHKTAPLPDIAVSLRRLYYDLAGAPVPTLLSALLTIADPHKIFYGGDWPFTPLGAAQALAAKIDETSLMNGQMRKNILSENAVRLFPNFS